MSTEKSKLDIKFIFNVIYELKRNFLLLLVQGIPIPIIFLTGLKVKLQILYSLFNFGTVSKQFFLVSFFKSLYSHVEYRLFLGQMEQ